MADEKKIDEIERLLKELKASKEETAVTVEEVEDRPRRILACRESVFFSMEKVVHRNCTSNFTVYCRFAVCDILHFENKGAHLRNKKAHFLNKFKT